MNYDIYARERARLIAEQEAHKEKVQRQNRWVENLVLSGAVLALLTLIGFVFWMVLTQQ